MNAQPTLFEGSKRLVYDDAIELTLQSMQAYGPEHENWGIAWSGGKDSSATLTLIVHLIDVGKLKAPKSLTVFYADTRLELPPLAIAAERIMEQLTARGNPFVVGKDGDREHCVDLYKALLAGLLALAKSPDIEALRAVRNYADTHLDELRGKNLACWCALDGKPCHADVLLKIANRPICEEVPV